MFGENGKTLMKKSLKEKILRKFDKISEKKLSHPIQKKFGKKVL